MEIMKKTSEIIMSAILITWIITMFISNMDRINGHKKCCVKSIQEVYEYEGWVVSDCENCDEID